MCLFCCRQKYDIGLPIWGLLLAISITSVYLLPAGFIYAMTTQSLNINLVAEIIPGYIWAGKPFANMVRVLGSLHSSREVN